MKCTRCGFDGNFVGEEETLIQFAALLGYLIHKAGGMIAIPNDEISAPRGKVLQILSPKGDTRDWILTVVDRPED